MTFPTPKDIAEPGFLISWLTCPHCEAVAFQVRWSKSSGPAGRPLRWPHVEFQCGAAISITIDVQDVWTVTAGCMAAVRAGLEVKKEETTS